MHVELNRRFLNWGTRSRPEKTPSCTLSACGILDGSMLRRRAGDEEIDAAMAAHKETIRKLWTRSSSRSGPRMNRREFTCDAAARAASFGRSLTTSKRICW